MEQDFGHNYEQTQETLQNIRFNGQFDNYLRVTNQLTSESEGYAFTEKGNTASDVITVANLVMTINERNDYDEQNHVQVIVVCGSNRYYIHPRQDQPSNCFLVNKGLHDSFNDSDTLDFYDFLKMYNEVRIVDITSPGYTSIGETIYKYYFNVDKDENGVNGQGITYSDPTRKVNKIVFTLDETEHFDNDTVWKETR